MSTSTSQDLRCPRCAATVRAGSDWCTLCYTDLRPAPPAPEPPVAAPAHGSAHAPAAEQPSVRRGKHARRDPSEAVPVGEPPAQAAATAGAGARHAGGASPEVELRAQALLAELAAVESGNPLGRWSSLLDTPARKVAFTAGGAGVLIVVLIALMAILGALV